MKTMGSTPTVATGWHVTVPRDDGWDVIYRGVSYTDAREARRKDGSPRARFERVDVDSSPS